MSGRLNSHNKSRSELRMHCLALVAAINCAAILPKYQPANKSFSMFHCIRIDQSETEMD